ncbi:MAG: hypothetical protein GF364_00400 [Candidatus Lokiarchaeota archaeon]|nr:hypothetical protein [Candidatus Lokiarchaeota archaeon]
MTPKNVFGFMRFDRSVVDITIRTDCVYNLTLLTGTGQIDLQILDDMSLSDLKIYSETGDINVLCGNSVNIEDLVIETTTGNIDIDCGDDFQITNNTYIKSDTGNINFIPNKNSTFNNKLYFETDTGSIHFISDHDSQIKSDLTALSDTGKIWMNLSNNEIGGNLYLSTDTGKIQLDMKSCNFTSTNYWWINSSTGDLDLNIEQLESLQSDVLAKLKTSTGTFNVDFTCEASLLGAKFDIKDQGTGSVKWDINGFTNSNPYTSSNYALAPNHINFELRTGTGDFKGNLASL